MKLALSTASHRQPTVLNKHLNNPHVDFSTILSDLYLKTTNRAIDYGWSTYVNCSNLKSVLFISLPTLFLLIFKCTYPFRGFVSSSKSAAFFYPLVAIGLLFCSPQSFCRQLLIFRGFFPLCVSAFKTKIFAGCPKNWSNTCSENAGLDSLPV